MVEKIERQLFLLIASSHHNACASHACARKRGKSPRLYFKSLYSCDMGFEKALGAMVQSLRCGPKSSTLKPPGNCAGEIAADSSTRFETKKMAEEIDTSS